MRSDPWFGTLVTATSPPWACTMALTRLKPNPLPRWERLLVKTHPALHKKG